MKHGESQGEGGCGCIVKVSVGVGGIRLTASNKRLMRLA